MTALIGALRVSLSAETAQFEAGMKRAQRTAANTRSSFQKSFGGLGGIVKAGFAGVVSGISIGLITQGVKAALEYAGSLGEVSQQLGVTTKDLQVFRFAAGQVGVSQEQLETGLSKLTLTMGRLAAGAKAPREALESVRKGLADQIMTAKDSGDAFRILADALEPIKSRAQRAAIEVAAMGKSGANLDNLLSGGSAALNELSAAAEKLGIVLSDEQIANADKTADKLDALKTVLAAQISGVVADNADAILTLANALAQVAAVSVRALNNFGSFVAFASKNIGFIANLPAKIGTGGLTPSGNVQGLNKAGKSVTISLPSPKPKAAASGGADIGKFLAGGGGSKKGRSGGADDAERKRQQALRDAYQFDQELLRAQMDTLRAQQSLATDYSERAAISIQLLNLDQQGFEREMEYAVASGDLSKAQAAQLEAEYAKKDALERQAVLAEEETQRKEDYNHLDQVDFDLQRDILESQEQIARTAKEQRDIRLRLLDLDYRAERARLEAVLADEKSSYAAKEEARRRLLALSKTYANDKQAVMDQTMGPMESFLKGAPQTVAETQEAMENLKVQGIQGVIDTLGALRGGFDDMRDVALQAINQIIAELWRMIAIKAIAGIVGGASGSPLAGFSGTASSNLGALNAIPMNIPGFATGGSFNISGRGGVDRNLLSLNGLPIARVSHGERISVGTDAMRDGSSMPPMSLNFYGPVSRETMMQAGAKVRASIASANRKGA